MKRQSSDSSDPLKNTTPRRSWDHPSPNRSDNTSNNSNQAPLISTSDASISEHQPVPSTSQSFPTYTYGASDYYNNRMDPNQMMQNQMLMFNPMQNYQWSDNCMYPMPAADSSYIRNMESTSNGNTNSSNFESQPQTQPMETVNTEAAPRSPSPLAVQYSDEEAASLMGKLRSEDTFRSALQVLISWIKNVEFNKSNITYLFSLINCAQNNVWRLMNEKAKYKEDLNNVNLDVSRKTNNITSQFQEIWKVFEKAKLQKVWDQFTRPQRKMINIWMQETKQTMSALTKELAADNMDPDEDSSEKSKNSNLHKAAYTEQYKKYKEEMDNLQNQLGAIQDDNATLRNEEDIRKKFYHNTMQDMDKQYDKMRAEYDDHAKFFQEVESQNKNKENSIKSITSKDSQLRPISNSGDEGALKSKREKASEDARIVAVIGSFLQLHPFGANVDYISSYLKTLSIDVKCWYIESLLSRFPRLFREESRGVGANLTKEWVYLGFQGKLK